MEKCKCWVVISNSDKAICYGVSEPQECDCCGDVNRCNFYPEKSKEKKMNTLEMLIQANKDGKTYKYSDMRYNKCFGFHDRKGEKWEGYAFKYINDIFEINDWQLKPDNEMTKSEAEAKFNIKIIGE